MNATSTINTIFNVNSINTTITSDIRFNIIKRREFVIYETLSDNDNTNLSYTYNQQLISDKNISLFNRADQLDANRLPVEKDTIIFTGATISLLVNNFIATNQFFTSISGEKIPLYYKHVLENFDFTNVHLIISDISIIDSSFETINNEPTIYDFDNGIVYNNIVDTFDSVSGDFNIKFVRYTVRNNLTNAINSYVEIINNQSVYRAATFDDLLPDGTLPPHLHVYTIEQNLFSNLYDISFNAIQTYAILESVDSRIHIKVPVGLPVSDSWFVSITNGNFLATLNTTSTTSNLFGYNVPEFTGQLYNPFAPYKHIDSENSFMIDNHLIKTLRDNIQFDLTNGFHIFVVVRNTDGTSRLALSTDTSANGNAFEDIFITNDIRSIDSINGIVDIAVDISDADTLEVSYYYTEEEYQIVDIDFNPVLNSDIIGERIVFYAVPNTTNNRTKCIYYLIINYKGIITFGNQTDNATLVTDIASGTFTFDKPSVDSSHLNFLDKYTLQASTTYEFTNPSNPKYFALGDVSVGDIGNPDKSTIVDIRTSGGGIKDVPGLMESLIPSVPEVQWVTNFGPANGFEYPGNATTVIEIPTYIQSDYGGLFNDIQLRSIIERHIGFGVYPVLRGYSTNVICTAEPITDSSNNVSLKISWRSYGSNKSYNLYYSTFADHGFAKANNTPITDNSAGNLYTINTGLITNQTYWIYVVSCDSAIDYPQSIVGVDLNHTFELVNKVEVKTYVFPS